MRQFAIWTVLLAILLAPVPGYTADRVPLRVARLPLMLLGEQTPSPETLDELETRLDRALHIPLNGVLHAVEYLPEKECEAALGDILAGMEGGRRKTRLKNAMQPLAERLQADIVICPVLARYGQHITFSGSWARGTILYSTASIELYGYEKKTGAFLKTAGRNYYDSYTPWGLASALALECLDRTIEESGIHSMVSNWNR